MHATPCDHVEKLKVDGVRVGFSRASEGTKVSISFHFIHALHALLDLIT